MVKTKGKKKRFDKERQEWFHLGAWNGNGSYPCKDKMDKKREFRHTYADGVEKDSVDLEAIHEMLGVGTPFRMWAPRALEGVSAYVEEGVNVYQTDKDNGKGTGRPKKSYIVTVELARRIYIIHEGKVKPTQKGRIYVMQFSNGLVKVGRSVNPVVRAKVFEKELGRFLPEDPKLTRIWASKPCTNSSEIEAILINDTHAYAINDTNREWRQGNFPHILKVAKKLQGVHNGK